MSPHIADELWLTVLDGSGSIHEQSWPTFDQALTIAEEIEIAVQVNGKVKTRISVASDAADDDVKAAAKEAVSNAIDGKTIVKEVVVPGRLVNIVVK